MLAVGVGSEVVLEVGARFKVHISPACEAGFSEHNLRVLRVQADSLHVPEFRVLFRREAASWR